jgi:hypothetical protein
MEVYEQKNFIGIKKFGSKLVCKGNIFVIIDIETNTVFDWVFLATETPFMLNRPVEVGVLPNKKYYTSVWYGRNLAYIVANENKPVIKETVMPGFLTQSETEKDKIIIDGYGRIQSTWEEIYTANVYDTKDDSFITEKKSLIIPTDSIGYIQPAQADPDGNYWLATQTHLNENTDLYNEGDYIASVWKIDCEENSLLGPVKQYKCNTLVLDEQGNEETESDVVDVLYVNDDYVFVARSPLGNYEHDTEIYLLDKDNPENAEKKIIIPYEKNYYLTKIFQINNKVYAMIENFINNSLLVFYPIDTESLCLGEKECEFNFDFTENVYVRGNRLYLMSTRRVNDVYYTWYDFETQEQGEIINVKYENVISKAQN